MKNLFKLLFLLLSETVYSQTATTGVINKSPQVFPTIRETPPNGFVKLSGSSVNNSGYIRVIDENLNHIDLSIVNSVDSIYTGTGFDSLVIAHNFNSYEVDCKVYIMTGTDNDGNTKTTYNAKEYWSYKYQTGYQIKGTDTREDVSSLFTWKIVDLNRVAVYGWKLDKITGYYPNRYFHIIVKRTL